MLILSWCRVHRERAASPVPSCVSMRSDHSKDHDVNFKYGLQSTDDQRSDLGKEAMCDIYLSFLLKVCNGYISKKVQRKII